MYKLVFTVLVLSALFSCAKWEQPTDIITSGVIKTERIILIDEFTGASCPNCPAGSTELERIVETYPDNVVVMSIHSKFLAEPVRTSDPDLRTPDAESIENFLGNYLGKPEAAFNRRLFPNKSNIRIGRPDTWINYVNEELQKPDEARLKIVNDYDESTRELKISVTATALINLDFPVYLHVALTESDIHTAQKNSTGIIDDYIHKHALRKLLTPVEGDFWLNSLKKGEISSRDYKFILPSDNMLWNADQMDVVAFISLEPSQKVVLQAVEQPVK